MAGVPDASDVELRLQALTAQLRQLSEQREQDQKSLSNANKRRNVLEQEVAKQYVELVLRDGQLQTLQETLKDWERQLHALRQKVETDGKDVAGMIVRVAVRAREHTADQIDTLATRLKELEERHGAVPESLNELLAAVIARQQAERRGCSEGCECSVCQQAEVEVADSAKRGIVVPVPCAGPSSPPPSDQRT